MSAWSSGWNGRMGKTPALKSCPFCDGTARMELTRRFGGFLSLAMFVEHKSDCIIGDKDAFNFGFIDFDVSSEVGKAALEDLETNFARQWNRRAGA